jgi:hypothetical protein
MRTLLVQACYLHCFRSIGLLIIFLVGCRGGGDSEVEEKIPDVGNIANAPHNMSNYVSEFKQAAALLKPRVHIPDRTPMVPVPQALIDGKVLHVDSYTNCSLSLVLSFIGDNWQENQRLYFHNEKSSNLVQINAFTNKTVFDAYLSSHEGCNKPFILAHAREGFRGSGNLYTLALGTGELKNISSGYALLLSPDRSAAVFRRSNRKGFHTLFLLHIDDMSIEPIVSIWEEDPGSGSSWFWQWSKDSKALNIYGRTSGFSRRSGLFSSARDFNLIFVVKDRKMYSIEEGSWDEGSRGK